MYEYAVAWIGGKSAWTLSTTPRRKVRESSLRSAGGEGEVEDARERGRRDPRERNEGGDAAARRALNDMKDSFCDRDSRGDANVYVGECPRVPAYRARGASKHREGSDGVKKSTEDASRVSAIPPEPHADP